MYARSGLLQVSPDGIDAAATELESNQIPTYREQAGYKGFMLLADRSSGKVLGISFWETEADLEASDNLGAAARDALQREGRGSGEQVREAWELVFDDQP